jgi:hypothetical protein
MDFGWTRLKRIVLLIFALCYYQLLDISQVGSCLSKLAEPDDRVKAVRFPPPRSSLFPLWVWHSRRLC